MFAQPTRTSISSVSIPRQRNKASKENSSDLQMLPAYADDDAELAYSILAGSALLGLIIGAVATSGYIVHRRNKT